MWCYTSSMQLNPTLIGIGVAILLLILVTTVSTSPSSAPTKERGISISADDTLVLEPLDASEGLSGSPRIKAPSRDTPPVSPTLSSFKQETKRQPRGKTMPPPRVSRMETPSSAPMSIHATDPLRTYGNEIATLLLAQGTREHRNAMALNALVKDPSNESHAAEVLAMSSQYERLAKQFETMHTPEGTVSLNKQLSRDYRELARAAHTLSQKRSSNQADAALEVYNEAALEVAVALRSLFTFFKDNKVQFSPEEPGFVFTYLP